MILRHICAHALMGLLFFGGEGLWGLDGCVTGCVFWEWDFVWALGAMVRGGCTVIW